MRKTNGITLIALVITIIVLLILAGVSISAITGENGIIQKAKDASEKTKEAEQEENDTLKGYKDYIDSIGSENGENEKRTIILTVTPTDGENLWNNTVTLSVTVKETLEEVKQKAIKNWGCSDYNDLKEKVEELSGTSYDGLLANFDGDEVELLTQVSLESPDFIKNIAAYMLDYSSFEELKSNVESLIGNGSSFQEIIANFGITDETEFAYQIVESMYNTLNYDNIDELENLGIPVISITTPYGTKLYTNSIFGKDLKCVFIENGTYEFTAKSGNTTITETIEISNIRDYATEGPYDIQLELKNSSVSDVSYAIDDSIEFINIASGIINANDSITFKNITGGAPLIGTYYVIKDKEYYKYFTDNESWLFYNDSYNDASIYFLAGMLGLMQQGITEETLKTMTSRQILFYGAMANSGLEEAFENEYCDGNYLNYVDDVVLSEYRGETVNEDNAASKYPKAYKGKMTLLGNTLDETKTLNFSTDTSIYMYVQYCLTADTYVEVVIWDDEKKKKIRIRKKIKDITYDDDLLVWNFDKGEFTTAKPLWIMRPKVATSYNLLKFSDGSILKTIDQHRIFNKEAGKFTYPMTEETPIGTTTYTAEGKEVKLTSKEVIAVEEVEYVNIITKYYMNLFANGILTSCRFSNLYPIKDMKYVKDNREIVGKEEYPNIPEEYYEGLRLGEQPREVNKGNDVEHADSIEEHIQNVYIDNAKEKM